VGADHARDEAGALVEEEVELFFQLGAGADAVLEVLQEETALAVGEDVARIRGDLVTVENRDGVQGEEVRQAQGILPLHDQ
jgi:hypothetical protein